MRREHGWTAAAFVVFVAMGAALWRYGRGETPTGPRRPPPGETTVTRGGGAGSTATGPLGRAPEVGGFRPLTGTVRDRAVRDDLRRRILAAWLQSLPLADASMDAGATLFAAMPTLDGGTVDPAYLRERIVEDFLPMAQGCYEQLLARHPGVGGRAVTEFVIVGDERVGGVVDEVTVEHGDGGLSDEGFSTCLSGSMSAMAFRPPPGRGSVRVRYPFVFTPDPADASR
ncbi:MAG: AgmX/PglI C-terminal domain-containing protein [Deltaproteobacteria bacterium]|nr:AgmX/PglI C-terminal domain-containing protein [Myxococcales bacterium]MDP3217745.1 AgmX/PglI C-terminal domain-containing protein [Deltaproteobacteria bacterium]